MATVLPNEDFDPEARANELEDAVHGLGTDEELVVSIMASHTNQQRQEIKEAYKNIYERDLEDRLKGDLRGDLERLVVALLTPSDKFDAQELRNAMKGLGTDESTLIEILCTRPNEEIARIRQTYEEEYGQNLEDDLKGETTGHFERLLTYAVNGRRDDTEEVDKKMAKTEATAIYDAGEGKWGTVGSVILQLVLCLRNCVHLAYVFKVYEDMAEVTIEEVIEKECSGSLQDGYLAIAKRCKDMHSFFAERMYNSMHGVGTTDETLIRIVTSRSEIDLAAIKGAFKAKYERSMYEAIDKDCHGDYKDLLLAIVGED